MTSKQQKQLVLHGAIILLIGFLLGIPFGKAILEEAGADAERAWRGAHAGLVITGLVLFAAALIGPRLKLGPKTAAWITWSLVASGWGFTIGLPLAAWAGVRGLTPGGPAVNWVVYVANRVGAFGALIGGLLITWGAIGASRESG